MGLDEKRGQVTIFIIIAIIIVSGVLIFFFIKGAGDLGGIKLPASIQPVYTSFLTCLEDYTQTAINVIESRGGYIGDLPAFEQGSFYYPFSSELNFLGNSVPYWYYVTGNNIMRIRIPNESFMEEEIENYIEGRVRGCEYQTFYEEGFTIDQGSPKAVVDIKDNSVDVELDMDFSVSKGEDTALVGKHSISYNSFLGALYKDANEVFNKQMDERFLERYAIDTLRFYAPVDGVEVACSPVFWDADEVFDNLTLAIEQNTLSLKGSGGDFVLLNEEDRYFVVELGVESEVRFFNSKNWPNSFEVSPAETSILIAEPVGNQPGLGVLGFCYVPYHFVYNVKYPVLVQVRGGEEIFQFPVAVVIEGNRAREPISVQAATVDTLGICSNKNTEIEVRTFDKTLRPVDSNISYECLSESCYIGETSSGELIAGFPQCVNGQVVVDSSGYGGTKKVFSTVIEGEVDIILDKLYEKEVVLKLDGQEFTGQALINFVGEEKVVSLAYPQQKAVELTEGQYEIQVQAFRNTTIELPKTTQRECVEIPKKGLGGLIGLTNTECFEVEIPSQLITNALVGGGKQNYFIIESELQRQGKIEILVDRFPTPNTIEQVQQNNAFYEVNDLIILFS